MRKLGQITQKPDGSYFVRVRKGRKRDGKQRALTGTARTYKEAEDMRIRFAYELGASVNVGDEMTLARYYEGFFLPARKAYLTRATIDNYDLQWRKRIEPAFGHRCLGTIASGEVQAWANGMTPSTSRHAVATLRAILRAAWEDGLIDQEPMRHRIRYPRQVEKESRVWGAAEVAEALDVMRGTSLEGLWLCMVGGGLRRSEACALTWGDVRFQMMAGSWSAVVSVTKAETDKDGLKPTKTRFSDRTVVIGEPFASRLLALREDDSQKVCGLSLGRIPRAWKVMWEEPTASTDGNGKYLKGKMLEAGIPFVPLARMRATHETLMQSAGVSDTLNSRLHGRSSVAVGYANYLEPQAETMAKASAAMADAIKAAR